jgi:hypothetical protein
MGYPVLTHGPVAYLQLDTPRSVWMQRLEDAFENQYDLSNIYFADTHPDETNPNATPFPFNILLHKEWLRRQLEAIADQAGQWPVAITLDTIREMHQGDENDSGVMQAMIAAVQDACGAAAKTFVSHKKKEGQMHNDDLMSDARGSSYVAGRMDSVINCATVKGNDNKGIMTWQSRTHQLTELNMVRTEDDGIWRVNNEEVMLLAGMAEVMADQTFKSDRQRAEALAGKMGITIESARSHIKRKKEMFQGKLVK